MIRLKSKIKDGRERILPDLLPHLVAMGVAGAAVLLIILGFLRPFYALPEISTTGEFFTRDSFLTKYFKGGLVIISILLVMGIPLLILNGNKATHLLTRATLLMFLLCLTYPTILVIYDPDTIGDGACLQQQHDTMTWLGGDIYRAHSERSLELGTGVNAQDPPLRLAVFKPPTGSLGLERLNEWIWWIGYGPSWTQFAGKGWFLMCFGFFFLTVVLIGTHWRWSIPNARYLIKKLVVQGLMFASLFAIIVSSIYTLCRNELRSSQEATAAGNYKIAYEHIQTAVRLVPGLINDTGIIHQIGYFQYRLGEIDPPESKLYEVYELSKNGYFERARTALNELWEACSQADVPRHCTRELARQQLRIAVNEINSSKTSSAQGHLNRLLMKEPNSIQALFHIQLSGLQNDDLSVVRSANEKLVTLYRGFKEKNKRGVLATSYLMLAQAEAKAGNTMKSWDSRLKSKGQR